MRKSMFLAIMLVISSSIYADSDPTISSGLHLFTGEEFFKDLPNIAAEGRKYFCILGFLILIGSSISYYNNAKGIESMIKHSLIVAAIAITITFIPQILNWADKFTNALIEGMGKFDTNRCIDQAFRTSAALSISENKIDFLEEKDPKFSITSLVQTSKVWINQMVKKCLKWIAIYFLSIWLWISSIICSVMDAIRYFILHMSSMILPIFLTGLATNELRTQSINYIYNLIGILCWPIGWAVGHIGTASLFAFAVRILDSSTRIRFLENTETINNFKDVLGGEKVGLSLVSIADYLFVTNTANLLNFICVIGFIGFWMIIVSVGSPFLIQKVVTSGGQFFSVLITNSYQVASKPTIRAFLGISSAISGKKGQTSSENNLGHDVREKSSRTTSKINSNKTFFNLNHSTTSEKSNLLPKSTLKALQQMGYNNAQVLSKPSSGIESSDIKNQKKLHNTQSHNEK